MSYLQTLIRKGIIFLTPNHFYLRSKLRNGAYVIGENRAGYGGRGVFIARDRIEPELEVLEEFLSPGDVFIDIGANTGVYTMKAAKIVGDQGIVIACEPFPKVFESLIKSMSYNKYRNVRLRNLCAGRRRELASFYLNFDKPHVFSLNQFDEDAQSIQVPVINIDELVAWENLKKVSYLKIDAEGSEEAIILGSPETIQSFRPIIQMETIPEAVESLLPDYECFAAPDSPNRIYIPREHRKSQLPLRLGWKQVF